MSSSWYRELGFMDPGWQMKVCRVWDLDSEYGVLGVEGFGLGA